MERLEPALFGLSSLLTRPDIEDGDGDEGDDEVDGSVGEHQVDTADVVLGEGNAAPGGVLQWFRVEVEIVDLGRVEECTRDPRFT